ncbi:MAG: helix-turn-helix transcriptional regulator [Tepidisphaeraceae bacterium]
MSRRRTNDVQHSLLILGQAIRLRREDIGLSQDDLGHLSGLHRTYVGGVERGERNLTLGSLLTLCHALQLTPHELLERARL